MKPLPSLLALAFAFLLAGSAAFADVGDAKPEAKPEKAACGCAVGADKKLCGVDKDCCCTGEKATGEKVNEKKADAKVCCADTACVPDTGEKADKAKGEKDCSACTACK